VLFPHLPELMNGVADGSSDGGDRQPDSFGESIECTEVDSGHRFLAPKAQP
jgi:hypothetical protein